MSDQSYPPEEPLDDNPAEETPPIGAEDHELPTRRIDVIGLDSEQLGETLASTTVPPDLPRAAASEPVSMADLLAESPDRFTEESLGETVVNPAIPPVTSPEPLTPDDIPVYSYSDDLPYSVPDLPPEPPVYGNPDEHDTDQERRGPGLRLARGRTARERRDSGLYLPWWSLLILLAVVAFFAALLMVGLNLLGGQFTPGGETPVVIIVTSTATRLPSATPTVTAPVTPDFSTPTPVGDAGIVEQATPLPDSGPVGPVFPDEATDLPGLEPTSPIIDPTAAQSVITPPPDFYNVAVGKEVEVFDTEAVGLNVRGGPGTGFDILFIADDAALLLVTEGPVPAGEYTWWKVLDEASGQEGWAVEDFIRVPQP